MRDSMIKLLALGLLALGLAGCAGMAPQVAAPAQQVRTVPVFIVPNCNIDGTKACQWIEPPAGQAESEQKPVQGIAL